MYFVIGFTVLIATGLFVCGWLMGANDREKSIRLEGLEDVNAHYKKMAENFNRIDGTIDSARSKLGGLRPLSQGDGEIPKK